MASAAPSAKGSGKGAPPPPPVPGGSRRESGGYLARAAQRRSEEAAAAADAPPEPPPDAPPAPADEWLDLTASRRFDVDDQEAMAHLDEFGYVVLREVASPAELEQAEAFLWKFLRENAGWEREDPSTWTDESLTRISSNGACNGILNKSGAGQADLSWHVRTLPNVRRAFELLWETQELVTSYDAFGVFRPWHSGRFMKTFGGWWHVDQGPTKIGRHAVQGLLSLYDQDASTGGFSVIPGSHLRHHEVVADVSSPEDYIQLTEAHAVWRAPHRIVQCRAGDFVLWDSRCVHCSTPAVEQPTAPIDRLLRAVVYVCMTPKAWASPETLQKRREGYEIRMTATHWPHVNVMGFGWARAPPLDFADASPERRALIC